MSVPQEMPRRRGRPPVIAVPEEGGRVIKKYGNRRLYDTRESRYVNQEALLNLFAADDGLRVLDASSGEDLTERVLAQAILGEDSKRERPLVPVAVLRALARFRGRERGALARHLTEAVATFTAAAVRGKRATAATRSGAATTTRSAAGRATKERATVNRTARTKAARTVTSRKRPK